MPPRRRLSPRDAAIAKVAKLIPSLSRESENEVLTTVRMIGRALDGAGLDFHDLARLVGGTAKVDPFPSIKAKADTFSDVFRQAAAQTETVPLSHTKALLDELATQLPKLNLAQRSLFDAAEKSIALRRQVTRETHATLLNIVQILRRQP